jgi:hypothetical protein
LEFAITVFVYPEHQAVRLEKIISGGQTGADRAALDVGIERGLQAGGWIPKGRLAEDGPISTQYAGLVEADSSDPTVRTVRNVRDSDATLIVSHGPLTGGSLVTFEAAGRFRKPVLHLDLQQLAPDSAAARLLEWLAAVDPAVLNVAGPRASEDRTIFAAVAALLRAVLPSE